MLDRVVVAEFLKDELKDDGIRLPRSINFKKFTELFCRYVEDDYYEWLKDNYKSFFEHEPPNWKVIRKKISEMKKSR